MTITKPTKQASLRYILSNEERKTKFTKQKTDQVITAIKFAVKELEKHSPTLSSFSDGEKKSIDTLLYIKDLFRKEIIYIDSLSDLIKDNNVDGKLDTEECDVDYRSEALKGELLFIYWYLNYEDTSKKTMNLRSEEEVKNVLYEMELRNQLNNADITIGRLYDSNKDSKILYESIEKVRIMLNNMLYCNLDKVKDMEDYFFDMVIGYGTEAFNIIVIYAFHYGCYWISGNESDYTP